MSPRRMLHVAAIVAAIATAVFAVSMIWKQVYRNLNPGMSNLVSEWGSPLCVFHDFTLDIQSNEFGSTWKEVHLWGVRDYEMDQSSNKSFNEGEWLFFCIREDAINGVANAIEHDFPNGYLTRSVTLFPKTNVLLVRVVNGDVIERHKINTPTVICHWSRGAKDIEGENDSESER